MYVDTILMLQTGKNLNPMQKDVNDEIEICGRNDVNV